MNEDKLILNKALNSISEINHYIQKIRNTNTYYEDIITKVDELLFYYKTIEASKIESKQIDFPSENKQEKLEIETKRLHDDLINLVRLKGKNMLKF